jgi:hypothetical protein
MISMIMYVVFTMLNIFLCTGLETNLTRPKTEPRNLEGQLCNLEGQLCN